MLIFLILLSLWKISEPYLAWILVCMIGVFMCDWCVFLLVTLIKKTHQSHTRIPKIDMKHCFNDEKKEKKKDRIPNKSSIINRFIDFLKFIPNIWDPHDMKHYIKLSLIQWSHHVQEIIFDSMKLWYRGRELQPKPHKLSLIYKLQEKTSKLLCLLVLSSKWKNQNFLSYALFEFLVSWWRKSS